MEFFLIISGYFLAVKANKKIACDMNSKTLAEEVLGDIKKRICNILPIFLVSFTLSFLLYHIVFKQFTLKIMLKDIVIALDELSLVWMSGLKFKDFQYLGPMWYFSALIICLMFIYPLLLKYKYIFVYIMAPLITLFSYGYLFQTYGYLGVIDAQWTGSYPGILRVTGGLCLGIIVESFVRAREQRQQEITSRVTFKIFVFAAQLILLLAVFYNMNHYGTSYIDYINTLLFAAIIYLTFIDRGYFEILLWSKFVFSLGKSSKALFISHMALIWLRKGSYSELWTYHYLQWMAYTLFLGFILTIMEPYFIKFYHIIQKHIRGLLYI